MNIYDLTVVMPVYNEAEAIGPVLKKWTSMLDTLKIRYRICAYNDGSKDATGEILTTFSDESNGRIIGITKPNSGHGPTILQGYREAVANSEWVFQIDSDDEMGPVAFPKLWEQRENYDFLVGQRDGRKQPLPRKIISFVSRLFVRLFYGKGIWDVNTPYRLMRASAFKDFYHSIPADTFAPNVILSGLAARHKLRMLELPVPQHDRTTGEVSIKKWKLLKAAAKSFWQTISFAFVNVPRLKRLPIFTVLCLTFIFYISHATLSGLWYDEGVEYFYSKVFQGQILDGAASNMYERICSTYQPPLYNVVMYIWLLFFDSEFGFRLAGILIMLGGAIGLYKALKLKTNTFWATITTIIFLYLPYTIYYTLECAEYYLMLACLSWTLYFFTRVSIQYQKSSLITFFIFGSLSVYSQYGAAFLVFGMAISLLGMLIHRRSKKGLKIFLYTSVATLFFAIIPLIYFFILPQMSKQGSITVTHDFYFAHGNLIYDLFRSALHILARLTGSQLCGIIASGLLFVGAIALILKRNSLLLGLLISLLIGASVYYLATATSYYGYNKWDPNSLGTMNVGGRYALFFLPIVVLTCSYSAYHFATLLKTKKRLFLYRSSLFGLILAMCYFIYTGITYSFNLSLKDDVREIITLWNTNQGYNTHTFIHNWNYATSQFYITHSEGYNEKRQEWIRTSSLRPRTQDQLKKAFPTVLPKYFYYICPAGEAFSCEALFKTFMKEKNYTVTTLYSGKTALLFASQNE